MKCVKDAVKVLETHDKEVEGFYNDPMTSAMGVPTGDFQLGFDAKERKILSYIVNNAPDGSEEREMALGRLEKWMP